LYVFKKNAMKNGRDATLPKAQLAVTLHFAHPVAFPACSEWRAYFLLLLDSQRGK
jgi:hypothetical protein